VEVEELLANVYDVHMSTGILRKESILIFAPQLTRLKVCGLRCCHDHDVWRNEGA